MTEGKARAAGRSRTKAGAVEFVPPSKPATIREVAEAAGVSLMTVSNVVNGRFQSMRAETRERVEQAIADLQYHPRGLARDLRLNREFAIGLLIVDPTSSFLADPFTSQAVAGLSNYLGDYNYGCLVHGVRPDNFESSIFLGDSRTAGLCVFLCGSEESRRKYLKRLKALRRPIIAIEDTPSSVDADVAIVGQDDFGAATEMTRRLLAKGCKAFHVVTPETLWPSVAQRLAGISAVIGDLGSIGGLEVSRCDETATLKTEDMLSMLTPRLAENTALIAATDRIASALSRTVRSRHVAPKTGILFASFGASETSRDLSVFDVVAKSDPHEIGAEAGKLLLDRLEQNIFRTHERKVPVALLSR